MRVLQESCRRQIAPSGQVEGCGEISRRPRCCACWSRSVDDIIIQPSSVAVCAGWCGQRHTRVFVSRAVVRCFAFVSVGRWHDLRVSVFVCPRERAREKERDSRNSILIIAMLRHDVVIPNSMYDATSSSSSPTQCMMPCHRRHPLLNVRFHNIVVIPYSMYDATSSSSSPR